MATNNKPANTLRCGNIKATIWQNVSEKGPFFATTFSRPFKDQSGAWRNGTSFGLNDLEALVTVAREAKEWIAAHASNAELLQWEASGPPGASFTIDRNFQWRLRGTTGSLSQPSRAVFTHEPGLSAPIGYCMTYVTRTIISERSKEVSVTYRDRGTCDRCLPSPASYLNHDGSPPLLK